MLQRLTLARSLIHQPRFLLLDEPFLGLDSSGVELLSELLLEHKKKGGSALIASHEPERVKYLASRIMSLKQGALSVPAGGVAAL